VALPIFGMIGLRHILLPFDLIVEQLPSLSLNGSEKHGP